MQTHQARRFRFCLGGANVPLKQNQNFLTYFYRNFKRLKTCRPPPPPHPRHLFAISDGIIGKERNCDRILIFGDIIYGKLNLFCPPPQGNLGRGKNFLGGGICPPLDTQTTSLIIGPTKLKIFSLV